MYTSYIGHKFLRLYNEREGKNLTAREFFDEVLFPLFFDAPKHFINVSNSSFFQPVKESELVNGITKSRAQLQRLHKTIESKTPDGSSMVGYAAGGQDGTTSGQVSTSVKTPLSKDDVYASWIGAGFGVYAGEKLSFYLDEPDVLWAIFSGWIAYRSFLTQTPGLKGNQIETWNGRWLCRIFQKNYLLGEVFIPPTKLNPTKDMALDAADWPEIVLALCRKFGNLDLTVNAYGFGSTNITAGFVPIRLREIQKLYEVRDHLFGKSELAEEYPNWLDLLYETELGFRRACERGQIGLLAFEPADIRKHIKDSQNQKLATAKEARFHFIIYQIWITAMLNNTELYQLAVEAAKAFQLFEEAAEKGKSTRANAVKSLFEASSKKDYLNQLADIVKEDGTTAAVLERVADTIWHLPTDKFPLFAALIRFQYFRQRASN
jgi:hypothetical protein